jgi:hypothetical protein
MFLGLAIVILEVEAGFILHWNRIESTLCLGMLLWRM